MTTKKKLGSNTKYSYDKVKSIFEAQGCELLSSEYVRSRDKLDYKCSCGNVSTVRFTHFLRGTRCRECAIKRGKIALKKEYDDVKKAFKDGGCELLSKDYKNGHAYLDYKCSCGRKSKITLSHFLSGKRCKKCGIEKMSGENNPNYNPNLSDEDRISRRKIPENEIWRTNTYKRDDYTCQKCFQRGGVLNAHHIVNYAANEELRFEDSNGITFCKSCHIEFHKIYGYKNNTQEQVDEFLNLIAIV